MEIQVRAYTQADLPALIRIWNEVVEAGDAFPQVTPLTEQNADEFFSAQTATMVADVNGIIFGMYPAIKASGLQPVVALRAE